MSQSSRIVLALLVVISVRSASAQASLPLHRKQSWEWTTEERLNARFDAVARKARVDRVMALRAAERKVSHQSGPLDADRPVDAIDGISNRELLLPTEIFTSFLEHAYAYDDETAIEFRRDAAEKIDALGLPADFLGQVVAESRRFIELEREAVALHDQIGHGVGDVEAIMARLRAIAAEQCPLRADALRHLRSRYGPAFDRFLYTAIAPNVHFTFYEVQDAQVLRRQEEGCP